LAQLEQAKQTLVMKRQIAQWYKAGVAGLPVTVHGESSEVRHSYWMCSILVDNATLRDPVRTHLAGKGIETRPLFYPVHTMPMYSEKYQRHPAAENLGWRGINLPSWPGLSFEQVQYVCRQLQEYPWNG
jgi:perosamine synthetase